MNEPELPDVYLTVLYVVPRDAIDTLEGIGVAVEFADGISATGIFQRYRDEMIELREVLDPEKVIIRTHIDNVRKVTVL